MVAKKQVDECPVCGDPRHRFLRHVREHEYADTTNEPFALHECELCHAWYLNPRPDDSALSTIYPANYYAFVSSAGREGARGRMSEMLFRMRMKPYTKHVRLDASTRWLEVGCAQGWALESLRDHYGLRHLAGVDISASAVEACKAKGFRAWTSRIEDFDPEEGDMFDVVHSNHVIEHVASPRLYMERCAALLRRGGHCIFATPNKASWEAQVFGRHWGGLHAPRHFTLLDPEAVEILAKKTGFVLREALFSSAGAFWTWSAHSYLTEKVGRGMADLFFPSDQRINDSSPGNMLRMAIGNSLDLAFSKIRGSSANMLVVLEKV